MFPVLISAASEPQFFVRDSNDDFDINIAMINEGTYSPLKLHRVSFFLDIGLEGGSPMGFGFDGSMIIAKSRSVSNLNLAIDVFNRVKASMMLSGLALDATTQSMIGEGDLKSNGYFRYTTALGAEAEIGMALQEGGAGRDINARFLKTRRITEKEVIDSYKEGSRVVNLLDILNPAFCMLSYSNLCRGETRSALVFGWVACEQIIEQFWKDVVLKDEKVYIDLERRKRLKDSQNVAQKIDLLIQAKIISREAYEALSTARKARNKFVHNGGPVHFDDALQCITGLLTIIQQFAGLMGIVSNIAHLLEVFEPCPEKLVVEPFQKAEDIDWSSVRWFRVVFPIPGDETWEGDEILVDGHILGNVTDQKD
ncbi:MAG: hypothetical protein ACJA1E_001831 [Paracoccaceae bacterium]